MADVRCPKCGKPNPADAEVCRHCWQRLKPAKNEAAGVQQPSSNEPDWLRELRSDRSTPSAPEPEETVPASGNQEVPDWLARIRSKNEQESSGLEDLFGATTPPAETTPDWLQDSQPAASADESGADWLSGLRAEQPSTPEETQPAGEGDWLNSLQGWQAPEESISSETLESEASAPDLSAWLSNLDSTDETTQRTEPAVGLEGFEQAEPASQETPDLQSWLQTLGEPETPAPEQPAEEKTSFGLTDWLKQTDETQPQQLAQAQPEPEPEAPARQSFGITGWLNSLEATENPAQPAEPPAEPVAGEIPSWMSDLEETAPIAPEAQPSGEADLPAWMADTTAEQPAAELSLPTRAPTEELPSWMAGFTRVEPPAEQPPVASEELPAWMGQSTPEKTASEQPSAPSEDVPGWLGQFGAAEEEPPTPVGAGPAESAPSWLGEFGATPEEESPAPATPAEGLPSWLGAFGAAAEEETSAPANAAPAENLPSWLGDFGGVPAEEEAPASAESTPLGDDWLKSFGQLSDEPAASAEPIGDLGISGWSTNRDATKETPSTPRPFIEEGLPAWMDSIEQPIIPEPSNTAPALYEEPDSSPLTPDENAPFKVDLPDWIGEEAAPQTVDAAMTGEEEPQLELAEAELPSWVEDMRPVESAIGGELTSDGDQRIEKAGPLAGLRGILPGEETAVRYRKLPVYSVKLRVSERQRQYINLLENVISLENQPQVVPSPPSKAPQFILRLAIGILMILGLLLPPLLDVQITPLPSIAPQGMLELYDTVESLPNNAPVLLAVEYEPALADEMKLASFAVIEHLMVKQARLAVVSTVPTGPIMAEDLLKEIQLRQPGYILDTQTVNLSYLAGGTTSLLEFANRPRNAAPVALDTSLTGRLPWDEPVLQDIGSLKDFALVIVLTDSAETGRAWVEQVQPMLGSTPLAMVTSAQAAPLLQPYLSSQQVDGLVSGLYGGAMYEKRSGRISLPAGSYMAYQGAFLVGILVLFLGGIISIFMSMSRRAKKGKA